MNTLAVCPTDVYYGPQCCRFGGFCLSKNILILVGASVMLILMATSSKMMSS